MTKPPLTQHQHRVACSVVVKNIVPLQTYHPRNGYGDDLDVKKDPDLLPHISRPFTSGLTMSVMIAVPDLIRLRSNPQQPSGI
jgi:hypothetical protein